jgi:hypothetical protein
MFLMRKKRKVLADHAQHIGPASSHKAISSPDGEEQDKIEAQAPPFQLKLPKETTKKSEFLIKHIRENLQKDNTSMVNVLRTWLTDTSAQDNLE